MKTPKKLRCLIVEDSAPDAEMVVWELRRAGFEVTAERVDTEKDFIAQLDGTIDAIISDFSMPHFDGMRALALRNQHAPGVPFILVSGTIGEGLAVDAMHGGASDYLLKDRLARLGAALIRALDAAAARAENEAAAAELRRSEAHYRELLEHLPVAAYTTDAEGFLTYYNDEAAKLWGFCPPLASLRWNGAEKLFDTTGKPWPHEAAPMATALRERRASRDIEVISERPDGVRIAYLSYPTPLFDATGALRGGTNVLVDISARKEAESALAAQLSRTALLNQIARAIAEREDLESIYHVVIANLEQRLPVDFAGVCRSEKAGEPFTSASFAPGSVGFADELDLCKSVSQLLKEEAAAAGKVGQPVYRTLQPEGGRPLSETFTRIGLTAELIEPLVGEDGVFAALVLGRRDGSGFSEAEREFLRQLADHVALAASQAQLHTALRQAYEELRQTQQIAMQQERLRAFGQMAAGVAHDINNAICVVGIYAELLLAQEASLSVEGRESLEIIHRAIQDVGHTVGRLREFHRQRESQEHLLPVPLDRLIEQTSGLTRARWNDIPQQRGIVISFKVDAIPELPEVLGVESEIREALINLIFNAVDAMPTGGTITVSTRHFGVDAKTRRPRVALEVSDTGVGMDEETRRRCLEPFFTTKGDRGSGLGLAMVVGIAQRHNAELEIDSAVGRGTTFRIIFDASGAAPTPADPEPVAVPVHPHRVLVVDDEATIGRALAQALESDGHAVTAVPGGAAAIDAFRMSLVQHSPFEIIVTDLGMPGMDGTEVAKQIKEMAPGTPVIMLTGWGRVMIEQSGLPPGVDRILSKPPLLNEIRAAIASFD